MVNRKNGINILLLCDDKNPEAVHYEHIQQFDKFSSYCWHIWNPRYDRDCVNLDYFDIVVIHYSLVIIDCFYVSPNLAKKIKEYIKPKVLFLQDEYRFVYEFSNKMADLGIHTLFTLVAERNIAQAWNHPRIKNIRKIKILTAYMPEHWLSRKVRQIKDRSIHITYRARELPYWLGKLAQDKVNIAKGVLMRVTEYGLICDISTKLEDRLEGIKWFKFISGAKCVLGTESGASLWDYEGKGYDFVKNYLKSFPNATFDGVYEAGLKELDENLVYNASSPRLFEAIASKTALVMFPGWYDGIVEPEKHYIVLEKDFSNFSEVAKKVKDDAYLQAMVNRAYEDIVSSGKYRRCDFVKSVDKELDYLLQHVLSSNHELFYNSSFKNIIPFYLLFRSYYWTLLKKGREIFQKSREKSQEVFLCLEKWVRLIIYRACLLRDKILGRPAPLIGKKDSK